LHRTQTRKRLIRREPRVEHARMTSELDDHYGPDLVEDTRLTRSPHGRLEYLRTRELTRRWLPRPGASVLDIGGGTGVHAAWLSADGHSVHVVDPVRSHVEAAASIPGVTAEIGDARRLRAEDGSVDVVLLMGPLYHLLEAIDRARALSEACRVLRPGGLLVAAGISRYLSLLEAGSTGQLDAALESSLVDVLATGHYDGHLGFVAAHFHTAEELRTELKAAGLADVAVFGIEGPSWPALDAAGLNGFDARVDAALRCARMVETDPAMIDTSAHLLGMGKKPLARS
jgi:SAM-dependent methyltransferase